MEKILEFIKGFGLSILFVVLGIYILNTTESILGTVIGTANIVFFGILIFWGIYKLYQNSRVN